MEIYYATKNLGKVKSLEDALKKYKINIIQASLNLPEPRSDDVKKIAREKVLYAYKEIKKPVVALDAGFYVHSLNGFPKAFVNFALETVGLEGILKLVEGKDRSCEFRHCLAYMDKELKEPIYFQDSVKGTLTEEKRGKIQEHLWSELTLIFVPEGSKKTLAEMTYEEYLKWKEKDRKDSYSVRFANWLLENRVK